MSTRTIIGCLVAGAALLFACGDDATDRSALPLLATRARPPASDEPGAVTEGADASEPASTDAAAPVTTSPPDRDDPADGPAAASSASTTTQPPAGTTTTTTPGASTTNTSASPSTTSADPTTSSTATTTTTPTTTRPTTTTTTPATTTASTTTTIPPPIPAGLYRVPEEVGYGVYRAFPSWATLDADEITLNSDVVDDCLTVMVVDERASFVEVAGEARRIEAFPTYDPIAAGCTTGTFLVGPDVQPGQYRLLSIDGFAYWARLDATLEIIDSEFVETDTIITVDATDFALSYTGTLERVG